MKIKITSPCMAMLIYEAAKSQGQTEGCLYGEMAQEITKNITDSDVTTTVEDVLSVHSIGPLQLSDDVVNAVNQTSSVYGWFRFCRRPLLRLTVREKSIHRKLAKSLASRNKAPGHTVTILMQERWSENHSTYLWKFAAFLQRDRWFIPCRIEIVNLKASTCGSYKPYPSVHQQEMSPRVTRSLSALNSSFSANSNTASFDMVQTVRNTGQDIVKSLNETITNLRSTETELELAYQEQENLKKTVAELQALLTKKNSDEKEIASAQEHCASIMSGSSDSVELDADDKLLTRFNSQPEPLPGPSTSNDPVFHAVSSCPFPSQHSPKGDEPPPPYDPFDSLVHIVKADLNKVGSEMSNEERPWTEKKRLEKNNRGSLTN